MAVKKILIILAILLVLVGLGAGAWWFFSEQNKEGGVEETSGYLGSDKFGLCDGFDGSNIKTMSYDLTDTPALGFGWGRPLGNVFSQDTVEKTKGSYDFSTPDAVVKKMQDAHIKVFGNLFPTGIPKIPATVDQTSFANYVKAVVDRYNGDGKNDMPGLTTKIIYWEVGIEPFCEGGGGATCYQNFLTLVKTAYEAAKSVDSSLMISPGGAAPIYGSDGKIAKPATALFEYYFQNGGANYLDFFNFHFLVGAKSNDIKKYMEYWKNYVPAGTEIWLSETGSRDVGDRYTISADADEEASWAKAHIADALSSGNSKIFWCKAEHSFSDMPKVVSMLQDYAKQYGGTPTGYVVTRETTRGQGHPVGGEGQSGGQQPPGGGGERQSGGQQPPGGGGGSVGRCGDGTCQDIEKTSGGCPQDCQ